MIILFKQMYKHWMVLLMLIMMLFSGPAGEARDWERDRSLHHADALISVTGKDKNNMPYIITQNLSDYHKSFWDS